jgi:hypothetical protein
MAPSSQLLAAVQAFFDALATFDPKQISATLSENFTHTLAPSNLARSVGIMGPMSGDALAQGASQQKAICPDWIFKVKEAWPNEATNVITVWAVAEGSLSEKVAKAEADAGNSDAAFYREYMFVVTVDAANKVERVVEFVDTESIKRLGMA